MNGPWKHFAIVALFLTTIKILITTVVILNSSSSQAERRATSIFSTPKLGQDLYGVKSTSKTNKIGRGNLMLMTERKYFISNEDDKKGKQPKNQITDNYAIRSVPTGISRFNFPWRIPAKLILPTLKQSKGRVLYSPLREVYGAGLGHAMATINADVSTAMRFNLTYTHRIAKYDILSQPFNIARNVSSMNRPFQSASAVEQLFGWGAGELPRDHLQKFICPANMLEKHSGGCMICTDSQLRERQIELDKGESVAAKSEHQLVSDLYVEQIVEIPSNLSYFYPAFTPVEKKREATDFIKQYNQPNTVFMMPGSYCNQSPAYSITTVKQRSFFFHKYWDAHGNHRQLANPKFENETFVDFKSRILKNNYIPHLGRRVALGRLHENHINIAVHARRGDFFFVDRPMISMRTISNVIRQIMAGIIVHEDKFSTLPVSINIYSEGPHKDSKENLRGDHDVSKMGHEFLDVDGKVLSESDVRNFLVNSTDEAKRLFKNGLKVNLRIAENTILSIHEMIASDIFIGSESGLSTHIVGSISRAAFLLLPSRNAEDKGRIFHFHQRTGKIGNSDILQLMNLWKKFIASHEDSLRHLVVD